MIKQDLKHTCSSGVTFELRPVPPLNLDDFSNTYDEMYPPPVPPLMEVNVAGKLITQPDTKDAYFVMLLNNWGSKKEAAMRHFILARGVVDDPPPDYYPDEMLYTGTLSPGKRKALWISDQLYTVDGVKELIEAIHSINTVTEAGLEESKNGTPLARVDSISSNGQSSQTLAQSGLITP